MRPHVAVFGALLVLAVPATALAQPAEPTPAEPGSISGRVSDAVTGEPMPDTTLRLMIPGNPPPVSTDADGRYKFENLAPRRYAVMAGDFPTRARRVVTLGAGEDLRSIDFEFTPNASISGVLSDNQGEPLADVNVTLLAAEYSLGEVSYFQRTAARTDEDGRYKFPAVPPNKPFLIRAGLPNRVIPAVAEDPADPEARRDAVVPTYYPNAIVPEEAVPVTLRPGERREQMDLRPLRAPSLCIEAEVQLPEGEAHFTISESKPTYGLGPSGGIAGSPPGGDLGADGKLRVCGLHRGEYRLTAYTGDLNMPGSVGTVLVNVVDRDVTGVQLVAQSGAPLSGRVEWVADPPETPLEGTVYVRITPRHRFMGAHPTSGPLALGELPVEFDLVASHFMTGEERGPLFEEHSTRIVLRGSDSVYVADVLYGGENVQHRPFVHGSAIGDAQLRVLLAHDGAVLDVRVNDEDGEPVSSANVYLLPKAALSHMDLADTRVAGVTDQDGVYQARAIPPGVYYVVATEEDLNDFSPTTIEKLWNLRQTGHEMTLAAESSSQLTTAPIDSQ